MSEISEVFSKDTYLPFLDYCKKNSFLTMRDLERCPFHQLSAMPGFSTMLASRIRAVYSTYWKALPLCDRPQPPAARPAAVRAMTEPELVIFLHGYFTERSDQIIKLADVFKAVGGRAKRGAINKILQQVAWCRVVDKATYFYTPMK